MVYNPPEQFIIFIVNVYSDEFDTLKDACSAFTAANGIKKKIASKKSFVFIFNVFLTINKLGLMATKPLFHKSGAQVQIKNDIRSNETMLLTKHF